MMEATARRILRQKNMILRKDRAREWRWNHNGGYMVIGLTESGTRFILAGETYDLTLEDVIKDFVSE